MKRATKASLNRLKKINTELARILVASVARIEIFNNIADYEEEGLYNLSADDYKEGCYTESETGVAEMFIRVQNDYERHVFMGASSKFGCKLVECTLTHGNNQVYIRNINKLEKEMTISFNK